MRFNRPFTGDSREVKKFILFPTKINGTIYWLETVVIHQTYNTGDQGGWRNDWVVEE